MSDPFYIEGPAVISLSGGRTSAYMLWRILQAHKGRLPADVVVCFANTGREMPATLDFVRDCGAAWNVAIVWLEYRWQPGAHGYEVVNHNSASRNGEPFEMMLAGKSMLPNPVMRFCTTELKIRTIRRFLLSLGWKKYFACVGLRADEPGRVKKLLARSATEKDGQTAIAPLAAAGIEEHHVFDFWRAQPFDLRLKGRWEGNCDGCFLKNRGAISRMARDYPERMAWWAAMENKKGGSTIKPEMRFFRKDRNYSSIIRLTEDQGVLPFDLDDEIPCDEAGCGV